MDLNLLKKDLQLEKEKIDIDKRIDFSNSFKVELSLTLKQNQNKLTKEEIKKIIIFKESVISNNIFNLFEVFNINKAYEFLLENLNFDISFPLIEKIVEILSFYDNDDIFFNSNAPKNTEAELFMNKQKRKLDFENFLNLYYDKKSKLNPIELASFVLENIYNMKSLYNLNKILSILFMNFILIKNSYLPIIFDDFVNLNNTFETIYNKEILQINNFLNLAK